MMKNQFLLNILLAIAWMLLSGEVTAENFIEGSDNRLLNFMDFKVCFGRNELL